jgi:hypothetical protein
VKRRNRDAAIKEEKAHRIDETVKIRSFRI